MEEKRNKRICGTCRRRWPKRAPAACLVLPDSAIATPGANNQPQMVGFLFVCKNPESRYCQLPVTVWHTCDKWVGPESGADEKGTTDGERETAKETEPSGVSA